MNLPTTLTAAAFSAACLTAQPALAAEPSTPCQMQYQIDAVVPDPATQVELMRTLTQEAGLLSSIADMRCTTDDQPELKVSIPGVGTGGTVMATTVDFQLTLPDDEAANIFTVFLTSQQISDGILDKDEIRAATILLWEAANDRFENPTI